MEWMSTRLKIVSLAGERVPLVPNSAQMKMFAVMEAQRQAGYPMRLIVLKSRRQGCSTGFEGYCFADVFNRPTRRAFVAAHDSEASQVLFNMNKMFDNYLPDDEKKPKTGDSKKELRWAPPHDSSFIVQTAGKMTLGRSDLVHDLHCSEVAFWPSAEQSLLSVLQCVPDEPDTAILIESTANGVGGEFYERWHQAVRRYTESKGALNGYVPLFLSWLDDPNNTRKVPKRYDWGELTDDELRLQNAPFRATPEQLYWRRYAIHAKCGGDEELFSQEYPATPESAFRHSGRPAIPVYIRAHHRNTVEEPLKCRLYWDASQKCGVRAEYGDFKEDCWLVWRRPDEDHNYTIGGDIGTGQLSTPTKVASAQNLPDANAAVVLDRRELMTVAARMDRSAPDLFGEEMAKAGWYYGEAWVSPEVNNAGYATLAALQRLKYTRIFTRQSFQDSVFVEDKQFLGWKTTLGNRDQMIDDYLAACRPEWKTLGGEHRAEDWEGVLRILWDEIVTQEDTFETDKKGKRQHRRGCFDDALFALFIAWQLHLRCPDNIQATTPPNRKKQKVRDLNQPGSVDFGVTHEAPNPRVRETV